MTENVRSTVHDSDQDAAPDLAVGGWPAKFARAPVRRGRPPVANPKVSTTIRLSRDVIDPHRLAAQQPRVSQLL